MADNTPLPNSGGLIAASDEIAGVQYQRVKLTIGTDGVNGGDVAATNPMPVALDSTTLAALENISVTVSNPTATGLTDTELRATAVPVSVASIPTHPVTNAGTFAVQVTSTPTTAVTGTFWQATQPVSGTVTVSNPTATGLTDAQLRATAVPVSGTVELGATSLAALENTTVTVSNPTAQGLTDAQIRATPLPVSGTVTGTFWQATQPVSAASLPLPSGAASETTLAAVNAKLPSLSGGRVPVELPAGGSGLTDAELRATPVPVSGSFSSTPDDTAALISMLRALVHPVWEEVNTGRLRVVLDPLGGAQTLGTVTTVGTVTTCSTVTTVSTLTNQAQLGGALTNSMVFDNMHMAWASSVRRAVS